MDTRSQLVFGAVMRRRQRATELRTSYLLGRDVVPAGLGAQSLLSQQCYASFFARRRRPTRMPPPGARITHVQPRPVGPPRPGRPGCSPLRNASLVCCYPPSLPSGISNKEDSVTTALQTPSLQDVIDANS